MTPIELLKRLHTTDLFLALACTQRNVAARHRFLDVYGEYLLQVALACSSSQTNAEALVDRVLAYLFAPGANGELPFKEYDGRISLAGWLMLIVKRMTIREEKCKANSCGPVAGYIQARRISQYRQSACLSESELGGYLSELTNAEERQWFGMHLPACEECRQLITFYNQYKEKLVAILPSELR